MATWLNIGCGDKQIPGLHWKNVDSRALKGIDYVTDIGDLHMYDDDKIDRIYACHVLEHVKHARAMEVLKEWTRVLKPQTGRLRVCVPHLGTLMELYHYGTHLGRMRGLIWGGQGYPENTHHCGWDYQELARDMRDCGFFNINVYDPWDENDWHLTPPQYRDFAFMTLDGAPCSLNVEALAI